MKINKIFIGLAFVLGVLASCENQDIEHPDFYYQTVYFANQYPLRTLELGEDLVVDNSMDNLKKVIIKATTGGVQENANNIVIDFSVDESLCNNLWFVGSGNVLPVNVRPMPSNYYTLASNQISIPQGSILGGVEVQLTDAFFADPLSLTNTYVIPLVMNNVQGADSILGGFPSVANPERIIDGNWTIKPKDYILYAIKYINPWHGNYLRRGADKITNNTDASVSTAVRRNMYVEKDELVNISTNSLTESRLPLTIKDPGGVTVKFDLILTFADNGTATVSSNSANFAITGSGKFVSKGEKNSFGGIDRSAIYLDYTVDFTALNLKYETKDTLVVRDRGVKPEYFTVIKK